MWTLCWWLWEKKKQCGRGSRQEKEVTCPSSKQPEAAGTTRPAKGGRGLPRPHRFLLLVSFICLNSVFNLVPFISQIQFSSCYLFNFITLFRVSPIISHLMALSYRRTKHRISSSSSSSSSLAWWIFTNPPRVANQLLSLRFHSFAGVRNISVSKFNSPSTRQRTRLSNGCRLRRPIS